MANSKQYEEHILRELQALPTEALPKVLRLITLVREEILTQEVHAVQQEPPVEDTRILSLAGAIGWKSGLPACSPVRTKPFLR